MSSRICDPAIESVGEPVSRFCRYILAVLCLIATILLWLPLFSAAFPIKIFDSYSIRVLVFLFSISYVFGWGVYFALSRNLLSSKIANCVLTTASFGLLVALLEVPAALGYVDYRSVLLAPIARIKPWEDPRYHFDRELLWIRRPSQRFHGEAAGDLVYWLGISTSRRHPFDVQYDSHGFRNNHEIHQAPLVVIGDSMVEWGFVPGEGLTSSRLSQELQLEVANLGQPAYGPQQELVVLRRYGLTLRPKIVLWFFFEGNDLLDVKRYETFTQNLDETVDELNSFKQRSFIKNATVLFTGLIGAKHRSDGEEARKRSCAFVRGRTDDERKIYFAYPGSPLSAEDLASLDTAQKVFLEAHKLSTDSGADFLFVYVPTKFRVYRDFCDFPEDGYGKLWRPNDLPTRLETWNRTHGIAYLDLTAALKSSAATGELVYFSDDGHLNAKGHEVAAEFILSFLKENGWL
jgi:hypothetical protein